MLSMIFCHLLFTNNCVAEVILSFMHVIKVFFFISGIFKHYNAATQYIKSQPFKLFKILHKQYNMTTPTKGKEKGSNPHSIYPWNLSIKHLASESFPYLYHSLLAINSVWYFFHFMSSHHFFNSGTVVDFQSSDPETVGHTCGKRVFIKSSYGRLNQIVQAGCINSKQAGGQSMKQGGYKR